MSGVTPSVLHDVEIAGGKAIPRARWAWIGARV